MEYHYSRGQKLLIKLQCGQIFKGDCINCASYRIDIMKVVDCINNISLNDMQLSFYRGEIANVMVLEEGNSVEGEVAPTHSPLKTEEQHQITQKVIEIPQYECERLKEIALENNTYLATVDNRYFDAMKYLSSCENIGLVGLGSESDQTKPFSLLVLASWDEVYILDLMLLPEKECFLELKGILESRTIKKVAHDSRPLVMCLRYCHNIRVNNIFDTQVSDEMIEKNRTGHIQKKRNLLECLMHYFNFPDTLLETAADVSVKEWHERPLNVQRQINAAQLASYLITLMNKMEKIMLKNFYSAVNVYSQLQNNKDCYTAFLNGGNRKVPEEIVEFVETDLFS